MIYGDTDCAHRGLRNERESKPTDIRWTGRPKPHGGFYATITCPDCGTELRIRAEVVDVWPADWSVRGGVPVPPEDE